MIKGVIIIATISMITASALGDTVTCTRWLDITTCQSPSGIVSHETEWMGRTNGWDNRGGAWSSSRWLDITTVTPQEPARTAFPLDPLQPWNNGPPDFFRHCAEGSALSLGVVPRIYPEPLVCARLAAAMPVPADLFSTDNATMARAFAVQFEQPAQRLRILAMGRVLLAIANDGARCSCCRRPMTLAHSPRELAAVAVDGPAGVCKTCWLAACRT